MTVRIAKEFDFDAAHFLTGVPVGHKCARMHGHTYRVQFVLEGEPDTRGMVCDYAEIAIVWDSIHTLLDHRVLNEVKGLENPTTEILTPWIFKLFANGALHLPLISVRVYESSTTWCEFSRPTNWPTTTKSLPVVP